MKKLLWISAAILIGTLTAVYSIATYAAADINNKIDWDDALNYQR